MADENSVWKRRSACVEDNLDVKQDLKDHVEPSMFCHQGYLNSLKRCRLQNPGGALSKCLPIQGSLSERKKSLTFSRRNLLRRTSSKLSSLDASLRRKSFGSWRSGTLSSSLKWKRRSSALKNLQNYAELFVESKKQHKASRCSYSYDFNDSNNRIASSDPEQKMLPDRIDYEMNMRLASTKLMVACNNSKQAIEAAKNILLSTARIETYRAASQNSTEHSVIADSVHACRGSITLSDIRLPLMWKNHFTKKPDKDSRNSYSVFCMVTVGQDIQTTQLIADVDRLQTDVCFSDVLTFDGVRADFTATVAVYSHRQLDAEVFNTGCKKLDIEKTENKIFGPRFSLIASSVWTLSETTGLIQSLPLKLVSNPAGKPDGTSFNVLPLFGCYCCCVKAVPDFLKNASGNDVSEWINIKSSSNPVGKKYWVKMLPTEVRCWASQDDVVSKPCLFSISLTRRLSMSRASDNELTLTLSRDEEDNLTKIEYTFSFANSTELSKWHAAILQLCCDLEVWYNGTQLSESISEIPASALIGKRVINSGLNSSDTGDGASPMTRVLRRLNIESLMESNKSDSHQPETPSGDALSRVLCIENSSGIDSYERNSLVDGTSELLKNKVGQHNIKDCSTVIDKVESSSGIVCDRFDETSDIGKFVRPGIRRKKAIFSQVGCSGFADKVSSSSNVDFLSKKNVEPRNELSVKLVQEFNESSV